MSDKEIISVLAAIRNLIDPLPVCGQADRSALSAAVINLDKIAAELNKRKPAEQPQTEARQ